MLLWHHFLAAHSEALSELVAQELWRRKSCPICGGVADFAFLEKEQGARWLMCSRCSMEWLFQRIQCPYCGTQKHQSLAYRTNSPGDIPALHLRGMPLLHQGH